ncbi:MAG: GNAT family N-acetyltransferase [Planctomycetota bacterium]
MPDLTNIEVTKLEHDDESGLASWDQFVLDCPRGAAGQLSTWLGSFRPYGARFTVWLFRDTDSQDVVAGIGLLAFGNRWLGWATAPSGPIVALGYEELVPRILQVAVDFARGEGLAFLQLQLPTHDSATQLLLPADTDYTSSLPVQEGSLVSIGMGARQLKYVEFPNETDLDAWQARVLAGFSGSTRRNIRLALKNELRCEEAQDDQAIREGFGIIESNGRRLGYPTRRWQDFGSTLITQVRRQHAVLLLVRHRGSIVGAHYAMLAGRRYTYSMGGNERIEPDPRIGHGLHWHAMLKARELGMSGYDFATGGTAGVKRFKAGFRPVDLLFGPPQYISLKPVGVALITKIAPVLRSQRKRISAFLSKLKSKPKPI